LHGIDNDFNGCTAAELVTDLGLTAASGLLEGLGAFKSACTLKKCNSARAVAPAKRTSGSTVLGHYPDYMNMADSLGHRRFYIPDAAWDKMTDAQRWAANQKFLDRTISRGDDILLSTPLDKVIPGSYFERELQYLSGKGYRPSADGTRLVPGGN
jgi:hypothetical protein